MGRPRGSRPPAVTRARVVAAVTPVFAADGFVGASTRRLAGAAGINVSTLAYHFGSKEGLYHAVLDASCAALLAFPMPASLPPEVADRIRTVSAALYRFAREHRDSVRLLVRHELEHGLLPDGVRGRWAERSFERLAALQAALPGVPLLSRRLELITLRHLIAGHAVASDDGLVGIAEGDHVAVVAAHLGEVAVRLLLD